MHHSIVTNENSNLHIAQIMEMSIISTQERELESQTERQQAWNLIILLGNRVIPRHLHSIFSSGKTWRAAKWKAHSQNVCILTG